jgi:hypothetical protein
METGPERKAAGFFVACWFRKERMHDAHITNCPCDLYPPPSFNDEPGLVYV